MIPESFIEELKYRADIEQIISPYTRLKRNGRTLTGLCPFHSEKTPSFVVYPENGSFYCFGCGKGGDIITFVREAEHLEYMEALRFLADKTGMALPEDAQNDATAQLKLRILECNRTAARFFHRTLLSPEGKPGLDYLRNRQLSDATIRKFGLGYAPDRWDSLRTHLRGQGFTDAEMIAAAVTRAGRDGGSYDLFRGRVMFPIIDLRGAVIGFGGRILGDGQPKYLNSPDTLVFKKSRNLFGMNFAKATKRPELLLCEGYMDAIAVYQAGFDHAIATLGTSLTTEQTRLLSQYKSEVVIAYDSDEAGQKATRRANELFAPTGVRVRVLSMPGAKDPDEFIKKNGAERFNQLIEGSANATEYAIGRLRERFDLEKDDAKVAFLREFCPLMARTPSRLEADVYITRIANDLRVSREAIVQRVEALRKKNFQRQEKEFAGRLKIYAADQKGTERDPQRTANLKYAVAEDKLLAILLKNPDYGGKIIEKISPVQFVTDANRAIYQVLFDRLAAGKNIDLVAVSGEFTNEQMGRLSYLLSANREQPFTLADAMADIAVILEKSRQKTKEQIGSMSEAELMAYIKQIESKKK